MKLLSIAIPCYNSANYLAKCVESLLFLRKDIEIILVNDGSSDETAQMIDKYAEKYPDTVKAIHQANQGHGGAVLSGLKMATGKYFKVLDSDDWFDQPSFIKLMDMLKFFVSENKFPDVVVTNYVYEKQSKKHKKTISFRSVFKPEKFLTWQDIGTFRKGQYLLMHTLIFEREFLLGVDLKLPLHTFYVDNLVAFIPLQFVRTFYYLDVPLYRYYIGRFDQSVQEHTMVRRLDQQLLVTSLLLDAFSQNYHACLPRQRDYLLKYFEIMLAISSILLMIRNEAEDRKKIKNLWREVKRKSPPIYRHLRVGLVGMVAHLPANFSRHISLSIYRLAKKVFGFN